MVRLALLIQTDEWKIEKLKTQINKTDQNFFKQMKEKKKKDNEKINKL